MLNETMTSQWVGRANLEYLAERLRKAGHEEAARELSQSAHRLGNALLEVEAVAQQYEDKIASVEQSAGREVA